MDHGRQATLLSRIRAKVARLRKSVRPNPSEPASAATTPAGSRGRSRARTTDDSTPARGGVASQPAADQASQQMLNVYLRGISWETSSDDVRLRIEGAAWRRDGSQSGSRIASVRLESDRGSIPLTVEPVTSGDINDLSKSGKEDRSPSGFVATLEARRLLADAPEGVFQRRWRVMVELVDQDGKMINGFTYRDTAGSASQFHSCDIGAGCLAQPAWGGGKGLTIRLARRALVAEQIGFDGPELTATIGIRGKFQPAAAILRRDDSDTSLSLTSVSPDQVVVRGPVADLAADDLASTGPRSWYLLLVDDEGTGRHVHWQGQVRRGLRIPSGDDPRIAVRYGPNGVIRIDVEPQRLVVDGVSADEAGLVLTGECHGLTDSVEEWTLAGERARLRPDELVMSDGRFTATFPTTAVPEWGSRPLPLRTANYTLNYTPNIEDADHRSQLRAMAAPSLVESLPLTIGAGTAPDGDGPGNRIRVTRSTDNALRLEVGPPRPDGQTSLYGRQRLEIMYRTEPVRPTDTIFLDSYFGKMAGDNTRALQEELVRRRPDLRPLWTVADYSIEVPDGAERIINRSEKWWRALASSRYVITNVWLPGSFHRRDHQQVLQAWHGTPLKLLGVDRIGTKRGDAYREKTRQEVSQWQFLIAQNPFSSRVFRSAYGYEGTVLEIGYPRNDILSLAGDEERKEIRARLGLDPDELVVLYAPTWREGAKGIFAELDFAAVTRALDGRGRLLVRGHSNTISHGGGVTGDRLLDVTTYPELSHLYLISDVMITDYSSAMFDFSVTGRPLIFFAPDIADYAGHRRGTYFDLASEAPGPVVMTTEDVVEALSDLDELRRSYAMKYAAWQQKYNPYDDGHASERAIDALLQAE